MTCSSLSPFRSSGETNYNHKGVIQGTNDDPIECALNEKGKEQCRRLHTQTLADINFDMIFASKKYRAIQTAELSSGVPQSQIITTSNLNERCFGVYEGRDVTAFKDEAAAQGLKGMDYMYFTPEGGESVCQVQERCYRFFQEDLLPQVKPHMNILVACHTYNVREIVRYMRDAMGCEFDKFLRPNQPLIGPVPNTSLTVFKVWYDHSTIKGVECVKLYDTAHLDTN